MKSNKLLLIFFAICPLVVAQDSHTSPNNWKEPRNFHVPLLETMSERIIISKGKLGLSDSVTKSPNNAYYFSLNKKKNQKYTMLEIMIFNEKDSIPYILLKNYKSIEIIKWINEKLIFIRVWFGRIAAADLIFDVEKEKIIYKETCYDGHQAYKQAKDASSTK